MDKIEHRSKPIEVRNRKLEKRQQLKYMKKKDQNRTLEGVEEVHYCPEKIQFQEKVAAMMKSKNL